MSQPEHITRQALDLALSLLATYSPPPAVGHIAKGPDGDVRELLSSPLVDGPGWFHSRSLPDERPTYTSHLVLYYPHGGWLFLAHNREEYEQRMPRE